MCMRGCGPHHGQTCAALFAREWPVDRQTPGRARPRARRQRATRQRGTVLATARVPGTLPACPSPPARQLSAVEVVTMRGDPPGRPAATPAQKERPHPRPPGLTTGPKVAVESVAMRGAPPGRPAATPAHIRQPLPHPAGWPPGPPGLPTDPEATLAQD